MYELNEKAFKQWFSKVANEKLEYATVRLLAWEEMEEMYKGGEAPFYELDGEYTLSGKTEVYS